MVLVADSSTTEEDLLVHQQQSALNLTSYENYPFPARLREVAYPLDAQGFPVAPELLSIYARDYDFSLPKCFHGRSVKPVVVTDYNDEGRDSVFFICSVSGRGHSKCGYNLDVSQLLRGGKSMAYAHYRRRPSPSNDASMDVPTPESMSESVRPLGPSFLRYEFGNNPVFEEGTLIDSDTRSITMGSAFEDSDISSYTSESYDADIDSHSSSPHRQPLGLRTDISETNVVLEEDISNSTHIATAVGRHIRTGDALCRWMGTMCIDAEEGMEQSDSNNDENKENIPPKQRSKEELKPPFKRRTRLVTSIIRS